MKNGLNVILPGLLGTPGGYEAFRKELERRSGRRTIVIASERFGQPHTQSVGLYPDALDLQARHVRDVLDEIEYEGEGKIYLFPHSMGTPIGLIFAEEYRGPHVIGGIVPITPGNLYAEEFAEASAHITRKIRKDLESEAGRNYWLHGFFEYLINPFRTWEEGQEVSEEPVAGRLMKELQQQGIPLTVAVSPDDDVFPAKLVVAALERLEIPYVMLTPGGRHSPDFHAVQLVWDLERHSLLP